MVKQYDLSWDLYPKAGSLEGYPSEDYFAIHPLITPAHVIVSNEQYNVYRDLIYNNRGTVKLLYSYDKSLWQEVVGNAEILVTNAIYFKATEEHALWAGTFCCDQPYYVSGKLSTLINPDYTAQAVHIPMNGFTFLFSPQQMLPSAYNTYKLSNLLHAEYLLFDNLVDDIRLPWNQDNGTTSFWPIQYQSIINSWHGRFAGMFMDCTSLTRPPKNICIQNYSEGIFSAMFENCLNLQYIPKITYTSFVGTQQRLAYSGPSTGNWYSNWDDINNWSDEQSWTIQGFAGLCDMFKGTQITLSSSQSASNQYLFRIPYTGTATGTIPNYLTDDMFGSNVSPAVNMNYYISKDSK